MDSRIIVPDIQLLPRLGWSMDAHGYVIYSSRKRRVPPFLRRGTYLHRAVIAAIQQRCDPLPPDLDVHHMDFNKLHNCPCNLLVCSAGLNRVLDERRCPWTGRVLSREKWWQLYGPEEVYVPSWVTSDCKGD
jgi:hypothetical protein